MDAMISTSDGQPQQEPGTDTVPDHAGHAASDLRSAASRPGVDACDVACEAMPGYVIGDLTPPDEVWLRSHTAECSYCNKELNRFEHLDEILDRLHDAPADPPPPRFLSSRTSARYGQVESPVGRLFVATTDAGVCEIGFATSETEAAFRHRLEGRGFAPEPDQAAVDRVAAQLHEYFGGRRNDFDLPLDFAGITPFTRAVLAATSEVPFGHLSTYREIARRVGSPKATRAVGNALGRNPIPVIVPCHRIVRSDSTLGGYTGGLSIKQQLLALEGVIPSPLA
jgi:methylated-DNA-[protein]-cysteine S-methyltransferase